MQLVIETAHFAARKYPALVSADPLELTFCVLRVLTVKIRGEKSRCRRGLVQHVSADGILTDIQYLIQFLQFNTITLAEGHILSSSFEIYPAD